jgi:hypothetical protein
MVEYDVAAERVELPIPDPGLISRSNGTAI